MKFKSAAAVLATVASLFSWAQEATFTVPTNTNPGKICILVTDVGTIDTVAKTEEFLTKIKQFNINETPVISEADKAVMPSLNKQEVVIRYEDNVQRYNEQQREIVRQNRRMEQILEGLRTSIIGSRTKRDIVVAKQYLQSYLSPYSNFIQVIDRSNTNLSEVEKAINGNSQQDLASACVFLTVIMQDLKTESQTVNIGNTTIQRTTYTQKAVGNLRDFNGNVIAAFNVAAQVSRRTTGAVQESGYNPSSDLMEAVLKQIADKIASFYICKVEFKCVGPKGDDNFDSDEVTFTMDGKEFENGDTAIAGKHIVTACAEGYKPITKTIVIRGNRRKMITKLKFKKAAPAKKVQVPVQLPAQAPAAVK